MKKRLRIGIVLADVVRTEVQQYLSGMSRSLRRYDAEGIVFASFNALNQSKPHMDGDLILFDMIHFDGLDGVVFMPETFSNLDFRERVTRIVRERCTVPLVVLGETDWKDPQNVQTIDRDSFAALTDHMIERHGYRDIVCLTGPEGNLQAEDRLSGFNASMERHGLTVTPDNIIYGDFWMNTAQEYAREIASGRARRPEAVVCASDIMALTLTNALLELGIKVPEQIAIAGFDGSEYAFCNIPAVTSFSRACDCAGEDAVEYIVSQIQNRPFHPMHTQLGTLQSGYTCGCGSDNTGAVTRRNELRYKETLYNAHYEDHGFAAKIAGANTLAELVDGIYRHSMIPHAEKYGICVRENWRVKKEEGTSWENEIFINLQGDGKYVEFLAEEMLPSVPNMLGENHLHYLAPIHFQDHFFGFSIVECLPGEIAYNHIFRRFSQEVSLSFEQLLLREQLRESTYNMYLSAIRDPMTGVVNDHGLLRYLEWKQQDIAPETERMLLCVVRLPEEADAQSTAQLEQILQEACGSALRFMSIRKASYLLFGTVDVREDASDLVHRIKESAELSVGSGGALASIYCAAESLAGTDDMKAVLRRLWNGMEEQPKETESSNSVRYSSKMRQMREEIHRNPGEEWSVEVLAAQLYISHSHFHRLYKQLFKITFTRDLIHARIRHAKKLLDETDATLTVIAEECGYRNLSHFMRQFHAEASLTPSQYRRGARAGEDS